MGKQIRIYLADGTAAGIRHAEIANWSGQALTCPRARFQELKDWNEVKRPGVYLLFGTADDTGEDAVYIGESEVVVDRLSQHMTGKDFWQEFVAFTSKDDNLTKGHIKYLESKLIQPATSAGRYRVMNSAAPQLPSLPRADRDAMDEYLAAAGSLLGVLGHRVLDPYVPPTKTSSGNTQTLPNATSEESAHSVLPPHPSPVEAELHLRIGGIDAKATRTDEGLVVLAGSQAAPGAQGSLSGGYRAMREKLVATGVLAPSGSKLQFTRAQLFGSPSQAAAVIVGYSINGREAWRMSDGTTYAAYEQRISDALLRQLETGR